MALHHKEHFQQVLKVAPVKNYVHKEKMTGLFNVDINLGAGLMLNKAIEIPSQGAQ